MKYIITESKLEKAVIHYLNNMYGDLYPYKNKRYPESVFYLKEEVRFKEYRVYMEYFNKNDRMAVDEIIWSELENIFGLSGYEAHLILKKWIETNFDLYAIPLKMSNTPRWQEICNTL